MYFNEILFLRVVRNLSRKFKLNENTRRIMDTLHGDLCALSHSILFRIRNVSDKSYRENQNTFYVQHVFPKIVPFMR
jgi:hypothetical protein